MATIYWPSIFKPADIARDPVHRTRSAGFSLSGREQVVASSAGTWRIAYDNIPLRRPEQVRAWHALAAEIEGRLNVVVVPAYPCPIKPVPDTSIPHSDDTPHSDGAGYWQEPIVASGGAQRGVVRLVIANFSEITIGAGRFFSANERLYVISNVESVVGAAVTCKIWPPLREAIVPGQPLEFSNPVCRVKLESDDAMNVTLQLARFGRPSVSFVETPF